MADKRKLGSGEKKFRDRSQNYKSSRTVHSNIKKKRPLTEEEKRILTRRKARKRRQAEQNKARIIFALALLFCLFLVFQVFATAFRFIEKSRKAQQEEPVTLVESSEESIPEESTEESTEEESPSEGETNSEGMVFSGGRYIDPNKPMVALTFDDGPDVQVDGVLMDELEKVNGRATFFVVGQRVEKYPEDIKNTVERGHEIGNHSYDHDIHLSKKGQEYIRNEFDKTDAAVEKAAGVRPALIRLPGGNISSDVKAVIQKPMIFWSIDTEDWRSRDAEKTQNIILSQIKDGDIVLMHALYLSTAQACKTVIPELHARGYQLVTVSELIHFRGQDVQGGNGIQYRNFPPLQTEAAESSTASTVAAVQTTAAETSANSSSKTLKESSKLSETKKETTAAKVKTASKSTESRSTAERTPESGEIVENPGVTIESRTVEKSTKEASGNIAGAIDADDP